MLLTTHSSVIGNENLRYSETIAYNEGVNAFTSYYNVHPTTWMLADPAIISTGNQVSVTESYNNFNSYPGNTRQGALKLWLWDSNPNKCEFFPDIGFLSPPAFASITKVINDAAESAKVFDCGEIVMTGENNIVNLGDVMGPAVSVGFQTENNPLDNVSRNDTRYRDGILRFPTRSMNATERMRGTWLKIYFSYTGNQKFNIFAMIAKYRKSYN